MASSAGTKIATDQMALFQDLRKDIRDYVTMDAMGVLFTSRFTAGLYNGFMRTLGFRMSDYLCRLRCLKAVKKSDSPVLAIVDQSKQFADTVNSCTWDMNMASCKTAYAFVRSSHCHTTAEGAPEFRG